MTNATAQGHPARAARQTWAVKPVHDRTQARSLVSSQFGIVASEHPLASQVGAAILEQGGSAADAAVATNAMMGLIAPMSNGVGGDLFAIVHEAAGSRLFGL